VIAAWLCSCKWNSIAGSMVPVEDVIVIYVEWNFQFALYFVLYYFPTLTLNLATDLRDG